MFLSKARFLSKFRPCFNFSTFKSGDISMDLLLTLSMQEADKKYKTNDELVQSLVNKNLLKTDILIQAMKKFDRSLFVKTVGKDIYQDRPHSIGQGEDISAPMMQAIAAEALYPVIANIAEKEPVKVIDIGTGSGYLPFMLYYALSEKFKNREDLHLTILGIDHELEFVKNTNLLFADFVEKGILEPHPSIIFKFAKREFFDYVGSPNMTGLENRVINIGAAVDLRTWETLKYAAIKKRGAILSPVVQPDGEQTLMFYKKEEGQLEESSIMKVMYAQMKKPEEIDSSSKFEKYFLKDNETDDSEGKPESKEDSANNSTESNDDIYLKELKAEVQELERHVKDWSENFKVNNNRTVSLKELKEDPGMANVLERLAKQKRRLGIMQRGIRPN